MEEAVTARDPTQDQNPLTSDPPPPSQPTPPPHPPAPAAAAPAPPTAPVTSFLPPSPKGKKRPLELEGYDQIQHCSYFKMRAVLKDIRPHLLEISVPIFFQLLHTMNSASVMKKMLRKTMVLQTADFRSCKGADELRERLKLLMQLYKQMTAEAVAATNPKNEPEEQPLSSENDVAQEPQEQLQEAKPADQPQSDRVLAKPPESKEAIDLEEQSYYIGGSAFGWNFVTFSGNKPAYYGRTKESFRAAQVAL